MTIKLTILLASLLILISGCTRHYHVFIIGNGNTIEVTAPFTKDIDTSAEADVKLIP